MMTIGERHRGAPRGRTQTIETRNGVTTVVFHGLLTIARINDVMAELSALATTDERHVGALVLDVTHIEGFEPGAPARIIHWLGVHSATIQVAVLVTPSPVLLATVRAAALLLPQTVYVATTSRAEGISVAERLLGARPRVSTDLRHRVISTPLPRKQTA